jgi:hypothetical protein
MKGKRAIPWPRIAQFVLVALGAAVVWGFTMGFSVELFYFQRLREARVSEGLKVREDGEVVVSSYVRRPVLETLPDRSLNGGVLPREILDRDAPTLAGVR